MAAEVGDKKTFQAKDGKGQGKPGLGQHDPIFKPLNRQQFHFSIWYFLIMLLAFSLLNTRLQAPKSESIDYSVFKAKIQSGEIHRVQVGDKELTGFVSDQGPVRQCPGQQAEGIRLSEGLSDPSDRRPGTGPGHGSKRHRIRFTRHGNRRLAEFLAALGVPHRADGAVLEVHQQISRQDRPRGDVLRHEQSQAGRGG